MTDIPAPAAPKVSVVCAWYNRADYIRETVDSILSQEFDSFEMVVVNDGSPDPRVREILDSYDDPRLRVIHQENRGFTTAIRRAVAESRGEFIAVQGSGDVSLPGRLREQARALASDATIVGIACGRENLIVDGPRTGERDIAQPKEDRITRQDLRAHVGSPLNHGEIMFRRDIYNLAGGYRTIFRFAQDMDLWLRMSLFGDFAVLPAVYYRRLVFADGVKGNILKTLSQTRYSCLAKACSEEVDCWGVDSVETFGSECLLFRRRDPVCAKQASTAALKFLYAGLVPEARYLAGLGWDERRGMFQFAALSVCNLAQNGFARKMIAKAFRARPPRDRSTPGKFLPATEVGSSSARALQSL